MSNVIKIIIFIGVLYAGLILIDSCRMRQDLYQLEAEYLDYKARVEMERESSDKHIKESERCIQEYEQKINELSSHVDSINFQTEIYLDEIGVKQKEIIKLRKKEETVENLKEQLRIRDYQFTLAIETIKEKDKIIFSITEKYNTQVVITDRYKNIIEEYKGQITLMEGQIKKTEQALKEVSLRLYQRKQSGKLKNYIICGLAGLTVYSHLKKP